MRLFNLAVIALIASPLAIVSGSAMAASAHNSQAGANGDTKNAAAPISKSRHMKHSTKHMGMHKKM